MQARKQASLRLRPVMPARHELPVYDADDPEGTEPDEDIVAWVKQDRSHIDA